MTSSEPRSDTEIRADLELPYTDAEFDAATARLVTDVAPLLARVSELTAENKRLGNDLAVQRAKVTRLDAILRRVIAERDKALAEVAQRGQLVADMGRECTLAGESWDRTRASLTAERDVERARREAVEAKLSAIAKACIAAINNANYLADMPLPEANALARTQAAFASSLLRLTASACQHCGHVGAAGDDHSCPCPNPDGGCPKHPLAAAAVPLEAPTEKEPDATT